MRIPALALFAVATLVPAAPATAQTVAAQMSCAQAIDYFARNRVIYKSVGGSVMPIRAGTPIGQEQSLRCAARGGAAKMRYTVATRDNPRCAIAVYCE